MAKNMNQGVFSIISNCDTLYISHSICSIHIPSSLLCALLHVRFVCHFNSTANNKQKMFSWLTSTNNPPFLADNSLPLLSLLESVVPIRRTPLVLVLFVHCHY